MSADPTIAAVSNASGTQGLANSLKTGSTTITATLDDDTIGSVSGSTKLTVTDAALVSIAITPAAASIAKGSTQQFRATGTYSDQTTQDITTQVMWSTEDTSVAAISNISATIGLATGLTVGRTAVSAVMSGTSVGVISGTTILKVTSATLVSIAVTPSTSTVAAGLTRQFTATGTFTDGSTQNLTTSVTWASADSSVVIISNADDSQGLATTVKPGSAIAISASDGGITGSTPLTVASATLVSLGVTPVNPSIANGLTEQFSATGTYTDGSTQDLTKAVTWSSADSSIATISNAPGSQGLAKALSVGQATIGAQLGSVTANTRLTVSAATLVGLSVSPGSPGVASGLTQQFMATGTFTDGSTKDLTQDVTWASSVVAIATISNAAGSHGLATTKSPGTSSVSATDAATKVTDSATLTVTAATLESLSVTPEKPGVAKGLTQQFSATGTFTDGSTKDLTHSVTWSSSDKSVATVSNASGSQGLANGLTQGQATIKALQDTVSGTTSLTVTAAALTSIQVTSTASMVPISQAQQYTATGIYTDGSKQNLTQAVTWTTSDTSIAEISNAAGSQGLAATKAQGTTTVLATDADTSISGSTLLTVTSATLTSIQVTPSATILPGGGYTLQFAATGIYSDNSKRDVSGAVAWSSTNPAAAVVDSHGLATSAASVSAPISTTIVAQEGGITGSTSLKVTTATLASVQVNPAAPSLANGLTKAFTAAGTFSDSTILDITNQVSWLSSDKTVATISNADGSRGLVATLATGTTTIAAALNSISGNTKLLVTAASLTSIAVAPATASIANGTSQQYEATGTYTDGTTKNLTEVVTWSTSDSTVAGISNADGSQGEAKAASVGQITITAESGGVSGTAQLTITAATLASITVTPKDATIPLGSSQQFTAIGTYTDSTTQDITKEVTWKSSDVSVVTISNAVDSEGLAQSVVKSTSPITITAAFGIITGDTKLSVSGVALASIALTPDNATIPSGTTRQYTAIGTYSDNTTKNLTQQVTWSSSKVSIADISNAMSNRGQAVGIAAGAVTITATDSGSGVSSSTPLTIGAAQLESITVTSIKGANNTVPAGFSMPYMATGSYSDGSAKDITTSVSWTSLNPAIATVSNAADSQGLVTGVAAGSTTIVATLGGQSGTASVMVTNATLSSIAVTPDNASLEPGATQQYKASASFSDGSMLDVTEQVTWASSNVNAISISNDPGSQGLATAGAYIGTVTISATSGSVTGTTRATRSLL